MNHHILQDLITQRVAAVKLLYRQTNRFSEYTHYTHYTDRHMVTLVTASNEDRTYPSWNIRHYANIKQPTYKALHTSHPPYLTDLLQYHISSVSMRSSTSQLLAVPRQNLSFGSRSFRVCAPKIWNSLIPQIRQCETLATFRCHPKTHYFQSAFSAT